MVSMMMAPAMAGTVAPKADFVFVVDTTGSMTSYMTNLRDNIRTFVNALQASELGIVIRLGLVEYKDISPTSQGGDGDLYPTVVHTYNGSTWMDVDGFITVLSKLTAIGGNDEPETAIDALGFLVQEGSPIVWGDDSYRFAILITDASNKVYNRWGYTSMAEIARDLAAHNICTSVIGQNIPDYVLLTEETGGILSSLTSNFSGALEALIDNIIEIILTWTVEFIDWDGTPIDVQNVIEGSGAVAPADPVREGYTFIGWDADFSNVTEDLFVAALYEPNFAGAVPSAVVTKLSGNKNELTITVTETLYDGSKKVISKTFLIDNNSSGTFSVGDYKVYVETKGNVQVPKCNLVK
jgi:hypothetical protein